MNGDTSPLLEGLAHRVREIRTEQSLTAKQVAERAGLSLRFFQHLEAGTANISITKLAAVAEALRTPLRELLPGENKVMVALLGLRGAGKSSVGPGLARALGCDFVELDDRIEEAAGLPLAEIFSLHGERYYRELEARCLGELLDGKARGVVALPGGIVMNGDLYSSVRTSCTTVWLRAHPDDHMSRVYEQGDTRPMANRDDAMGELRSILRDREPRYRLADITVDTSGRTVGDAVSLVREELKNLGWA